MWTELSVERASLLRADAALTRMVAAGATVEAQVFPQILADFHRMERRRFDQQGPEWAPLSDATLAIRRKKGIEHDRILEQSGRLRAALTGESNELRIRYLPGEMIIEVPDYGKYHHIGPRQIRVFGGPTATLPQRRLWEIRQTDALRWSKIVARGLRIYPAEAVLELDDL